MIVVCSVGISTVVEIVVPSPPAHIGVYNSGFAWRAGYMAGYKAGLARR